MAVVLSTLHSLFLCSEILYFCVQVPTQSIIIYNNVPNYTGASVDFYNAKNFDLHAKNKEEKLTNMWNQTVPIPGRGAKIWSGENRAWKVYILKSRVKSACFGFLDTFVIA